MHVMFVNRHDICQKKSMTENAYFANFVIYKKKCAIGLGMVFNGFEWRASEFLDFGRGLSDP